jgi:hypothetical protein
MFAIRSKGKIKMKQSTLTKKSAHIWEIYNPIPKRITRKGKVLFEIDGEKYLSDSKDWDSIEQFNDLIICKEREENE